MLEEKEEGWYCQEHGDLGKADTSTGIRGRRGSFNVGLYNSELKMYVKWSTIVSALI